MRSDCRRVFCAMTLAGVLGCSLSFTGTARAFCRTTTVPSPPGYDPSLHGCWPSGTPIAWLPNQSVPYQLAASASRQVSLEDATRLAHLAFDTWSNAACAGGAPSVTAYDSGPLDAVTIANECSSTPCNPSAPAAYHLITFRDDSWPYDDPANTLALTTVTYDDGAGILFDAEIEINSHDHALSTHEPPPSGTFDLRAILTHEAGHFLGLAHATDTHSVMYAYYEPGSVDLTADDLAGVCAVYPPQAPVPSCSLAQATTRSVAPGPLVGIALAALAFVVRHAYRKIPRRTRLLVGRERARPVAGREAVLTFGADPRRRDREAIGRPGDEF